MHRIDTPTAQVDKFGVGKNGFTAGNPQTGELPTALDQDFFDSVQEELAGVIEGASIQLNKASRNQLLTALKKLFLQPGNNLSEITNAAAALSKLGGAPLENPTFTGTPKGPTAAAGTSSTQLATTAFAQALISGLLKVGNNLSEIAAAGSAAQALTRGNIGLGTAAVANVGTGANQIPDMNSFASGAGRFKLPSGHMVQYGSIAGSTSGPVTATFPIPFTTSVDAIVVGCRNTTSPVFTAGSVVSTTSFTYLFRTSTAYTNDSGYFIAIGI